MMHFSSIAVGLPHPLWRPGMPEGAIFEWRPEGPRLALLVEPQPGDAKSFRKAPVTSALLWRKPTVALVFRWNKWLTFDCFFNAALYPEVMRPDVDAISDDGRSRLLVMAELIDRRRGTCLGLRAFTLSPRMSTALAQRVREQMADPQVREHHEMCDRLTRQAPTAQHLFTAADIVAPVGR